MPQPHILDIPLPFTACARQVPSAKTRWTSVIHNGNRNVPAPSNQLFNPFFNELAIMLEEKFDQVNDFPLEREMKLKQVIERDSLRLERDSRLRDSRLHRGNVSSRLKPKHMRVPPILQSIENVGFVSQRRCTVLASFCFCHCHSLNQFDTPNRKCCVSLTPATFAQLDLLYAHAEFINDHFQLWVADWFRMRDSNGSIMTFESSESEPGVARTTSAGVARTTSTGGTPAYVETKSKMFANSNFTRDDDGKNVFDINMEDVAAIAQRGPAKSIERSIEKVQPQPAHMLMCYPQPPTALLRFTAHTTATRGF